MANETNSTSVESDNQVDLNNNQNGNDAKSCVNKEKESDDLVLKLKRIILEQEKEELKQKNNQLNNQERNQERNQENNSSVNSKQQADEDSPKSVKQSVDQKIEDHHSESTKMESTNDRIDSSPLPSRKEITNKLNGLTTPNKSTNELTNLSNLSNGKSNDLNIDHHVIKDTIEKLTDKASQIALNRSTSSSSSMNGSFKINGRDSKPISKSPSLNQSNGLNQTVETKNDLNKDNLKKDKEPDSIKIIQSKSLNKSIKTDLNNNLDQILQKTQQHLNSQLEQKETINDKEPKATSDKSEVNKEANLKSSEVKQDKPDEIPDIELIIRASNIDSKRKGADLFCQEYFMDLYLLAELKYINLKISTVDLKKPPANFRSKFDCTKPPSNEQRAILENEKIERYIMKNIPNGHLLFQKDTQSAKLIENLYSKFKLALSRNEPQTKQSLLRHLEAIDKHLAERKTKFLTGDHVCCFDCEMMSKLQHIRVAGSYFIDDFEIPKSLTYLWNYMDRCYHLNAFIESAPADQDILAHYLDSNSVLVNRNGSTKKKQPHIELQKPSLSISTP